MVWYIGCSACRSRTAGSGYRYTTANQPSPPWPDTWTSHPYLRCRRHIMPAIVNHLPHTNTNTRCSTTGHIPINIIPYHPHPLRPAQRNILLRTVSYLSPPSVLLLSLSALLSTLRVSLASRRLTRSACLCSLLWVRVSTAESRLSASWLAVCVLKEGRRRDGEAEDTCMLGIAGVCAIRSEGSSSAMLSAAGAREKEDDREP